jgi:hypothetical protein
MTEKNTVRVALIADGAIGEPIQVEANFSQNLGFALRHRLRM